MSDRHPEHTRASLTGSGAFEKRGGYSPTGAPVSKLPRVPKGPAPGATAKPASAKNTPGKR